MWIGDRVRPRPWCRRIWRCRGRGIGERRLDRRHTTSSDERTMTRYDFIWYSVRVANSRSPC